MPGTRLFSRMALELANRPPSRVVPRRKAQSCSIIVVDPFGQFRGQPAQDWMYRSVSVVDPLTWLPLGWVVGTHHLLVARGLRGRDVCLDSCTLEKMNIEALFSLIRLIF